MAFKPQRVPYNVSKFHKLWSTTSLKYDQSFYPPSVNVTVCFVAGFTHGDQQTELN